MHSLPIVFAFIFILFGAMNKAGAQADTAAKKQISTVDVNRSKNLITVTYADGSNEIMTEQEANKKGLIHNGGYGNESKIKSSGEGKTIRIKSLGTPPVLVLDGKEITEEQMKAIKPETIESINVLKDKTATDKYGVKGKNGVVEISLKKVVDAADEFNGKKIYEWIGAEKTDEIISFKMVALNDQDKEETVEHKGPFFTEADRRVLQNAKPDRKIIFQKIVVKRAGVETKLPAKIHRF